MSRAALGREWTAAGKPWKARMPSEVRSVGHCREGAATSCRTRASPEVYDQLVAHAVMREQNVLPMQGGKVQGLNI